MKAETEKRNVLNDCHTDFSVIMFCDHAPDLLESALEALGKVSTRDELEVMVIDDGAFDGRGRVAEKAAMQGLPIRYFHLPGIRKVDAWNHALRESTHDRLAFLDDDCVPPPGWLRAFEDSFDGRVVGVVGGPDEAPEDASAFEKCLDYVLSSPIGTLGFRRGSNRLGRYYPRPWNMAASRELLVLAGGFDEESPEAPEVPMIHRLEGMGYRVAYQPKAMVRHRKETSLSRFAGRDFRLGMDRGRCTQQPGVARVYSMVLALLAALLSLSIVWTTRAFAGDTSAVMAAAYALAVSFSGLHAAISMRNPAAMVLVPFLLVVHHIAHIAGYCLGRLRRRSPA